MPKLIAKIVFKFLLVFLRVVGLSVGPMFMAYTFMHGRKLFYLDMYGWGVITILGFAVAALARLRQREYVFDSVDEDLNEYEHEQKEGAKK